MFYSDVILTKRGPLARVWLAAHWERKLSKAQFLQTDIEQSVDAIMGQGTVPMALRLSGQLLLGVVRIYSRKTKYLLDDCNETLLKIKMAFRSGAVDLTSDQLTAPRHTITLQPTRTEFDLLMPNQLLQAWNVDPYLLKPRPGDPASAADRARSRSGSATPALSLVGGSRAHSLRPSERAFAQGNFGFGAFAENESDFGLDSYDFGDDASAGGGAAAGGGFDLGMDDDIALAAAADRSRTNLSRRSVTGAKRAASVGLGGPRRSGLGGGGDMDDSLDIGVGRDGAPEAGMASLGSALGGGLEDGASGFGGLDGGMDMGFNFGGDDLPELDLGFGPGLDDYVMMPQDQSSDAPRPATPDPEDSFRAALANVTPRTAGKIREAAERRLQAQAAGPAKGRRQIVDRFTELDDNAAPQKAPDQWSATRYLPRSRAQMELLAMQKNPAAYFFPWYEPSGKDKKTTLFFGDVKLAPELRELFTIDLTTVRRKRAVSPEPADGLDAGRAPKRFRSEDGDLESEVGRRADPLRELSFGPFGGDDGGMNFGGDDFGAGGGFDFSGIGPGPDEPGLADFGGLDRELSAHLEGEGEGGDGLRRSMRKVGQDAAGLGDDDASRPALGRLSALTRLSTPEDGSEGDSLDLTPSPSNPLAAFAARSSDAQADANSSAEAAAVERVSVKSGLSRNTVRAVKVLKSQLQAGDEADKDGAAAAAEADADAPAAKTMSFEEVSSKASRRAAAGFFFELLVLATKDCVKVKQEESYGDVQVQAKQKLWSLTV
ncbi:hypothetical protein V8E36_007897 [Tilletia maclaganii]